MALKDIAAQFSERGNKKALLCSCIHRTLIRVHWIDFRERFILLLVLPL